MNKNMEWQVCSLDLAKKLRELGVKQESLFWWDWNKNVYYWPDKEVNALRLADNTWHNGTTVGDFFSAFTVAELGEMLKSHLQKDIWLPEIREAMDDATYMRNEADARAKMLVYLLENKLISVQ